MALLNYRDKLFIEMMEEFKERYVNFVEQCERSLFNLQNPDKYTTTVDELFRMFHNLKSNAALFEIKPLVKTASIVEDVLGILRFKKPPISRDLLDWLLNISDYMKLWAEYIDNDKYDLPAIDSYTLHMVKIAAVATEKSEETLKNLTLLVIHSDKEEFNKISLTLSPQCKTLFFAQTRDEAIKITKQHRPQFILLSSRLGNVPTVDFVRAVKRSFEIPILVLSMAADIEDLKNFGNMIDGHIILPFDAAILENRVKQLAGLYFADKEIKIVDKDLIEYIKTLQALPQTVIEIQQKASDPDSALRDLAQSVTKDPIISSKMLSLVNSPLYGFSQPIASVNQAVTMLGKEQTAAIALMEAGVGTMAPIDLSPYKISSDIFYAVSKMRMELMMAWYSKISFANLPILTTTALLGNLGQLIIARTIKQQKKEALFETYLKRTDVPFSEQELVGATAEEVSADILAYWGLDSFIVDSIRYSRDLARAPDDVKELAVANYIVYNTVKSTTQCIEPKDVSEMVDFVKEMNMKPDAYMRAVEKVAIL